MTFHDTYNVEDLELWIDSEDIKFGKREDGTLVISGLNDYGFIIIRQLESELKEIEPPFKVRISRDGEGNPHTIECSKKDANDFSNLVDIVLNPYPNDVA